MPLPVFNFRLPREQAEQLKLMALVYSGSGSTGVLLRDMVGAALSGDRHVMAAFNSRLLGRLGEQLTLDMLGKPKPKPTKKKSKRGPPR